MNAMHQATALLSLTLLCGCATPPAPEPPRQVITIQQPCLAAAPEKRPPLPPKRLSALDPTSPGEVVKAFALSLTEHRARADALDKLLDACK